jgi:CBS domain-containing protein
MNARELMTQPVVTVRQETSLAEVAQTMVEHRTGCVPVVDKHGRLCGIVTQTDFSPDEHGVLFSTEALLQLFSRSFPPEALELVRADAQVTTAGDAMSPQVITASEETPVEEIARYMLRYDVDHIPVVRDGVPVGMVARHDFLRMIAGGTLHLQAIR